MLEIVIKVICCAAVSTTLVCHIHVWFESDNERRRIVSNKTYKYILVMMFWTYVYFLSIIDNVPDKTPTTGPITLQMIILLTFAMVSIPFAKEILRWATEDATLYQLPDPRKNIFGGRICFKNDKRIKILYSFMYGKT